MSQRFDLLILGTGPASSRIVEACADPMSVAVVDSRGIGGTCALRGCNPKKVLVHAAELIDGARRSDGELVRLGEIGIDWPRLHAFQETFTDPVVPGTRKKYEKLGVAMFEGEARFVGPAAVEVAGERIDAGHVVIATGAAPAPLDLDGAEHVVSSDDFLALEELPRRVLFIGGGYISCEFASVAARAGVEVVVLEEQPAPLAGFHPELVELLVERLREVGVEVRCGWEVESVERVDGGFRVEATGDGAGMWTTDLVVHGAGRVPNVEPLQLERANVEFGKKGVVVDSQLRSVSNPRVFAAGDVVDCEQPKLTPVANEQGRTVARVLKGESDAEPDYGAVPRVAFTVPAVASVGLDESQAEKASLEFEVRKGDMSDWSSVRKVGGGPAAYRVLVECETERLLGAHLIGPRAEETINLFALAMKFGHTATDLKSVLFAFPTFGHDVRSML
jgi:glutathione reductase (NADPH)